ncbi:MAG: hypothetical protein P4L53_04130 [Candidatus Obscuribacterales bacterium]|nr:hypothetical protein [Candidatus Obscuribacterales bacterium]
MNESDWAKSGVFDRRFRIVRKLGTGGMSTVYEAEDTMVASISK